MNKLKIIAFICFSLIVMSGCKPESSGELGEPFDKVEGMIGTWELTSFTQLDLNNPINEVRDLSDFYIDGIVQPMQLTLEAEDYSYSVEIEKGKNFFGENGTWSFDNLEYPSYIIFDTGLETFNYELGSLVRTFDNSLSIEFTKGCVDESGNDIQTVIYQFQFTRVS